MPSSSVKVPPRLPGFGADAKGPQPRTSKNKNNSMKLLKTLGSALCIFALVAAPAFGAEKPADKAAEKQTCCQTAKTAGKECTHKCCVAAHKDGKSCEKCNPAKQDLPKKDSAKEPAK